MKNTKEKETSVSTENDLYSQIISDMKDKINQLKEYRNMAVSLHMYDMKLRSECEDTEEKIKRLIEILDQYRELNIKLNNHYDFNDSLYLKFFINEYTYKVNAFFYFDDKKLGSYLYDVYGDDWNPFNYYDSWSEVNKWIHRIMCSALSVCFAEPDISEILSGQYENPDMMKKVIEAVTDTASWQHKILEEFFEAAIQGAKKYAEENPYEFQW